MSLMKLSAEGSFPSPKASQPLVQPRNSGPPHHGLLGLVTVFRVGRFVAGAEYSFAISADVSSRISESAEDNLLTSLNLLEITNSG